MTIKPLKLLQYFLLFAIVGLAIWRLLPHIQDFNKIYELKDNIHYGWLLAALGTQFTQYIGDAWLSRTLLLLVDVKARMKDSIRIASLNVFAAHLLPIGEAGGVAATYHFYRKLGVTPEKFIFLTICWAVIANLLLFLLLIIPVFFISNKPAFINKSLLLAGGGFVLIGLTLYIGRNIIFVKLEKVFGKYKWFSNISNFFKHSDAYKKLLIENPSTVLQSFLAAGIYHASNVATLAFSFLAFNTLPPLELIVFAYSASLLFGRITLTPAGIGAVEASLILIFTEMTTVNNYTLLAAIFLYRFISFWLPIPAGLLSFYSLTKETRGKKFTTELTQELKDDLIKISDN